MTSTQWLIARPNHREVVVRCRAYGIAPNESLMFHVALVDDGTYIAVGMGPTEALAREDVMANMPKRKRA